MADQESDKEKVPNVDTEPTQNNPAPEEPSGWDGTFTEEQQAHLDKLFKKKGEAYVKSFAKDLGYDDPKDLKADLNAYSEKKKEEMSELERAQKERDDYKRQADEAEASRQAAERKAQIVSEAQKLDFADPLDAVALVGDAEDIEAALKELAESKPYLIKTKSTTTPSQKAGKSGMRSDGDQYEALRQEMFGPGRGFAG